MAETFFLLLESFIDRWFPTWTHLVVFLLACAVALWAGFHFHGAM
jgi:hypothetical protein